MRDISNAETGAFRFGGATVGIAGLGGLGSNIAAMLARAGVGRLVVADFDVVEKSNLNRQNYFVSQVGMAKTEATVRMIAQINPDCEVAAHRVRITAENTAEIFGACGVVCEALDDAVEKAMFANAVLSRLPGVKLVAASGLAGTGSANLMRTYRAARNFYLCGDESSEPGTGRNVVAPRVICCAAHQANAALRLLAGETEA